MKTMIGNATTILLCALSLCSADLCASNVDWNSFSLEQTGVSDVYTLFWSSGMTRPRQVMIDAKLTLAYGEYEQRWLIGDKATTGLADVFTGNILLANAGDLVDDSTARFQVNYFLHDKLDNEPYSNNMFEVSYGKEYYFAIVAGDFQEYREGGPYDNVAYGWAKIGVGDEGELSLLGSAMGLDGQAMIVGGGAVPEPTAAMLLLLGVAGLALRRRRFT